MVGCKKFWSTSREKDKFPSIQLEAGQIWTAAASKKIESIHIVSIIWDLVYRKNNKHGLWELSLKLA